MASSRINDALRLAQEADLDLVEVAPTARPPVAKLMDYGKFKYESALKARESRKNQAQTVIKEIKIRPKIDPHDYGTKKGHVERFLRQGDKVKVTIMFRGREQSRPELGFRLLQRLAGDVEELGFVESQPEAGRPEHDHGHRAAPQEDRRQGGSDPGSGQRQGSGTGSTGGRPGGSGGLDGGASGRAQPAGRQAAAGTALAEARTRGTRRETRPSAAIWRSEAGRRVGDGSDGRIGPDARIGHGRPHRPDARIGPDARHRARRPHRRRTTPRPGPPEAWARPGSRRIGHGRGSGGARARRRRGPVRAGPAPQAAAPQAGSVGRREASDTHGPRAGGSGRLLLA